MYQTVFTDSESSDN